MSTQRSYEQSNSWVTNEDGADPAFLGMQTLNNGNYRMMDAIGTFNPRVYWANVIDGPDDNWQSTSFCTIAYVTGTVFVSSVTWYYDSAKTKPMLSLAYTYSGTSYMTPTSCKWTLYNSTSVSIHTCTDTYTYSGALLTAIARVLT